MLPACFGVTPCGLRRFRSLEPDPGAPAGSDFIAGHPRGHINAKVPGKCNRDPVCVRGPSTISRSARDARVVSTVEVEADDGFVLNDPGRHGSYLSHRTLGSCWC